ncbi:MAG: PAS domain S-box protein [Bacteroidota bacterium]
MNFKNKAPLKKILDVKNQGFLVLDADYNFVKANRTALQMLSAKPAYLSHRNFFYFIPKSNQFECLSLFKKAMVSNKDQTPQQTFVVNGQPLNLSVESYNDLWLIQLDNAPSKLLQNNISTDAFALKNIVKNTKTSYLLVDTHFKIRNFNAAAKKNVEKYFNKTIAKEQPITDFVLKTDQAYFYADFTAALKGKNTKREVSYTFQSELLWFELNYFPVKDEQNKIAGVSISVKNITDNKRAAEDLAARELKCEKIIEAAPHPIMIIDKQGKICLVNKEVENVFGYTTQECQQLGVADFIQEDLPQANNVAAETNKMLVQSKTGTKIPVEISFNSFTDKQEEFKILIFKDLRKNKHYEATILSQSKKLKEIAWLQSHLVRQPVSNVLGLIQVVEESNSLPDKLEAIEMLKQCTQQLDEMIQTIVAKTKTI